MINAFQVNPINIIPPLFKWHELSYTTEKKLHSSSSENNGTSNFNSVRAPTEVLSTLCNMDAVFDCNFWNLTL